MRRTDLAGRAPGIVLLALALLTGGCQREPKALPGSDLLTKLDYAFQPFRRDFEQAEGRVRLVCVVAPTCGNCNAAAIEINGELLYRLRDLEDLEVYMVWTSVLPTDVFPRAIVMAKRLTDPRIHHYWDESGQIARSFGAMLSLEPGVSAYDIYLLYPKDAVWDPEGKMASEPPDWRALKNGWKPGPALYRMTQHQGIRLPSFDKNRLEAQVRELAAR